MARILFAEDVKESTMGTVATLRVWGNEIIEATSLTAARQILEQERPFDCATLDQRLPFIDAELDVEATNDQITALAHAIGARVPFLWLTAHHVSRERMDIPGCIGDVGKAGEVTHRVLTAFVHRVEGFQVHGQGMHLDQVLVEFTQRSDGRIVVQVPTWRSESFEMRGDLLPQWVRMTLTRSPRRVAYAKARAWLGAQRHRQLDLCEFARLSPEPIDYTAMWDD